MDLRLKIVAVVISLVCVFCLSYAVYYEVIVKAEKDGPVQSDVPNNTVPVSNAPEFDTLFDNKLNYQGYNVNDKNKVQPTKDLVYTVASVNEIYEGKYEIHAEIPIININTEKVINMDREINAIFRQKVNSIMENGDKQDVEKAIYTVDYTAYINQNILSLVIKSTLKEGNNAQRLIIKAYTYNLSTDEEISLDNMLNIKGANKTAVEQDTMRIVREAAAKTDNLASLGYKVYERDLNNSMYKIENSNNYFLGPKEAIYIIYAYGNSNLTSERDIVVVE